MTTTVATLKAVFTADTADFDKGKRKVEGGLSSIGASISGLGDSMSGIGRSMIGFAAPVTAALGGAVYAAMDFDEQLRNIQAVTGDSTANIDALGQSIIDMNTRFSSTELAATFYEVAGGVTDANARMDVFNAAISTAQAGNADLQSTTSALISVVNAYGADVMSAATASDILTQAVAKGKGSMDEFATAIPDVAGLAASMGLDFGEVSASLAYLTTKGFTASQASTQLRAAMTALLNPNEMLKTAIQELGYASGQALVDDIGSLDGALMRLQDTTVYAENGFAPMLGSVEALSAALNISTDEAADFLFAFTDGIHGATAAAEEIQKQSAAFQFDVLKSSLQDVAIQIGLALLPAINRIGKAVLPIVTKFAAWAKENPKLITTIAAIAIGITGLGIAFTVIGGILGVIGTAFTVFGAILGVVLSPIGLVVLGIGALAAAIYFLSGGTMDDLISGFRDAAAAIGEFATGLYNAFQSGGLEGAGQFIRDNLITPLLNTIANTDWNAILADMWARFKVALESAAAIAWDALTWINTNILEPLKTEIANTDWNQVATDIGNMLTTAITTMLPIAWDAITWVWSNVVVPLIQAVFAADWASVGNALWEAFKLQLTLLSTVWEGVSQWVADHVLTPIWNEIKNADYGQIAKDVAQGLWDGLVTQASDIIDMHKWILDEVINPVLAELGIASPSTVFYEVGTNIVQGLADGLRAMVGVVATAAQAVLAAASGPLNSLISLAAQAVNAAAGSGVVGDAVSSAIGNPIVPAIVGGTGSTADVFGPGGGLALPTQNPRPQAKGGPVSGNELLLVGERGPELFVPSGNGSIIPNNALSSGNGGGGGQGVVINGGTFIVQGVQDVEDLYNKLAQLNRNRTKPAFKAG